ncbi:DsrE/DsrF/DrsH-like family protein [Actinotalea sp.]|uniref:DsrE/DsrF/DrsH-like family protein n=1 Tax=Actinotalea sp. TaxID=1872145 RepID=UPI003564BA06
MDTTKKTIIVFSGDFDKVVAAFIIANGAAAMDDEVTMFFTFWGLNALRRPDKVATTGKSPVQKAFAAMMPRGPGKLTLSHMNFAGAGAKMMRRVMRQQKIMPLEELIDTAREQGVKMIACTMSMDVMGLRAEELIDGLEYAGVASYLGDADEANVNLFI